MRFDFLCSLDPLYFLRFDLASFLVRFWIRFVLLHFECVYRVLHLSAFSRPFIKFSVFSFFLNAYNFLNVLDSLSVSNAFNFLFVSGASNSNHFCAFDTSFFFDLLHSHFFKIRYFYPT